jgi:hypothetical protein
MLAGTRNARTTIASTASPATIATPMVLMDRISPVMKLPITTPSSTAAALMIPPVRWSPTSTAVAVSPVRSHSSRTRESRNTS